jgi:hypothetical protein
MGAAVARRIAQALSHACARPLSMVSPRERRFPRPAMEAARPAMNSASPHCSASAARCGPRSLPSNTSRNAPKLAAASPPARSAAEHGASPISAGSIAARTPRVTSKARNGPMGVASSQPAAPCTTQARSTSMPARVSAIKFRGGLVVGADQR